MSLRIHILIFCALVGFLEPTSAAAGQITLTFHAITNNAGDGSSAGIGEAQLRVIVTDVDPLGTNLSGDVLFIIQNIGPQTSSITGVFFEDGTLLGMTALRDKDDAINGFFGDPNVDFTAGSASPGNLPSANSATPPFYTSAGFLSDADPPVMANGINPGESLTARFMLLNNLGFNDVLNALNNTAGFGNPNITSLRIGLRVQAFGNEQSESFVNNVPVPEPSSFMLLGIGVCGLGCVRRRQAKASLAV